MRLFALLMMLAAAPAWAQQSAGFRMHEHVLNAGGRPQQGVIAASSSFRLSVDSIGEGPSGATLTSASYRMIAGYAGAYPPPGEVVNLHFDDATTMAWDPEASAGVYNVYRDGVGFLPGTWGACYQLDLSGAGTTEPAAPPPGAAWFYLVTVENLIAQEGTKGFTSGGLERSNPAPCP